MPNRLIREGILDSESVNALTFPAEVFYRRLMSVVDDFGRFDGRPSVLRSRLYPLKIDSVREADISRWIAECEKAWLIALYAVDGRMYILFNKFRQQTRAKESKFPQPPGGCVAPAPQPQSVSVAPAGRLTGPCLADAQHVLSTGDADAKHVRSETETESETHKTPPTPRKAGGRVSARRPPDERAEDVPIPAALDTPDFRAVWFDGWLRHRANKAGKRVVTTAESARQALARLAKYPPAEAAEKVRTALANQWQGVVFSDDRPNGGARRDGLGGGTRPACGRVSDDDTAGLLPADGAAAG